MKFKKIIFVDKFEKNHDVSVSNEGNQLKSGISNEFYDSDNPGGIFRLGNQVLDRKGMMGLAALGAFLVAACNYDK